MPVTVTYKTIKHSMKVLVGMLGLVLLTSCDLGLFCSTDTYTYNEMVPVYITADEMTKIESLAPQPILSSGKIYLHHDWLLINEPEKGIHVLNNSDPAKPVKLAFIAIPGNHDLLVKQDGDKAILYADNYTDLVTIDISDPGKITVLKRLEQVFNNFYPQPVPAPGTPEEGILVGYTEGKQVTERFRRCPGVVYEAPVDASPPPAAGGDVSQGGSLARFASIADYLYTIDQDSIQTFHLETPSSPVIFNRVGVNFGIETLFAYFGDNGQQLYVGGNQGMYIFDASDPANLQKQGSIDHLQSCDPVVVQGNLAYITLQGSCFNQINRLEIIDVSDPNAPRLIKDYALQEPYGLGIDGDYLFVCDGAAGLKVYENARDPLNLNLFKQFAEIQARDIIPVAGSAIVIAENGLFQYDYSALAEGKITLLSSISIPEK
ncbi:MAG: hypothetical protein KC422_09630 [Trueperaceae bacterium]|nr:hypothetical protein [Trueperaceae bacterium]